MGQVCQGNFVSGNVHPPGLDFGKVEDFINELKEIIAAVIDDMCRFHLLLGQVVVPVTGEITGKQEQAVQGCAELMRHICQKLGFVSAGQSNLFRFLFKCASCLLKVFVFSLDLTLLVFKTVGFVFQFLVYCLQLLLLVF